MFEKCSGERAILPGNGRIARSPGELFLTFCTLFVMGSSFGWLLELGYRSASAGHIVLPGFLNGPCLPIYGFGLSFLYLFNCIDYSFLPAGKLRLVLPIVMQTLLVTVFEYFTGLIFLKIFHVRLWDYTGYFGNIQGLICPSFLLAWGVLCAVYSLLLHRYIKIAIHWLRTKPFFLFLLGVYAGWLSVDVYISFRAVGAELLKLQTVLLWR